MARRTKQEVIQIKRFIAELLINRTSEVMGSSKSGYSPSKIQKLVEDELGITVSENTIVQYLDEGDLDKYSGIPKPEDNENLQDLKKRINIAKSIASDKGAKTSDRTKALNSYNSLMKTMLKYEKVLAEERLRKAEVTRPIYKIEFGHFDCTHKVCPKCHHVFLDDAKEQDDLRKKYYRNDDSNAVR